jgi:hypothetical protein
MSANDNLIKTLCHTGVGLNPALHALGAVVPSAAAAHVHVANPTGGTTTDAEARTAINAILVALETFGMNASS